jgi:hypothetical protein
MHYQISFERKSAYLHVTVRGENTKENVVAYLKEIREACRRSDCFRVLIEERLEGPRLDVMDVFAIASEGSMDALGVYEAIAYVDVNAGELMGFAETVAVNRGMPVAVFQSVTDAELWLRAQKSGSTGQDIFLHGSDA